MLAEATQNIVEIPTVQELMIGQEIPEVQVVARIHTKFASQDLWRRVSCEQQFILFFCASPCTLHSLSRCQVFRDSKHFHIQQSEDSHFNEKRCSFGGRSKRRRTGSGPRNGRGLLGWNPFQVQRIKTPAEQWHAGWANGARNSDAAKEDGSHAKDDEKDASTG